MAGNVKVLFNHLPRIKAAMPGAIAQTVNDAAHKGVTYAKDLVRVDTGALWNSIEAKKLDETTWEYGPHTDYDIYQEFGTRKMSAQPYMRPSAEKIRKEYPELVVDTIVSVAKGQGGWFSDNAPDVSVEERAAGS
jgi:HK97 gp10 family phage protein